MKIEVYDPALCCSSGVCGPDPDSALIEFAADFDWLRSNGVSAVRFNLGQEPGAFAASAVVRKRLGTQGVRCLPLVVIDGEVFTEGRYPTRSELSSRIEGAAVGGTAQSGSTGPRATAERGAEKTVAPTGDRA
ncbi:MAG: arsenite efflux transporter metallochaperone ArsD [Gemmatimonadota bacterium]